MKYTIFGIRHHGPGSAKSLRKALQQLQPDCLLIEAPADAEATLKFADNEQLKPPVAMLLYNPKDLQQASYFPLARFSPEWQAIQYGLRQKIPVQFMDLPMELSFGWQEQEKEQPQLSFSSTPHTPQDEALEKDPLGYIAQLAGFSDRERWWEATFEQQENDIEIFEAILDIMTALRAELKAEQKPELLLREAFMRTTLRKAIKNGFQNIAIVCGAWHGPALQQLDKPSAKEDAALLRGIKKIKTTATWIPWTYELLSHKSGYAAGVLSPAWYELLFQFQSEETVRWMVKAARLIRGKDLDASAAHALEAVRLAETLATLRQLPLPGIEELKEAAITILCEGIAERFQLIEKKLIIGDKIGKVPDSVATVSLQTDIEQQIKSNKLTKYWKSTEALWLKATDKKPRGGLDLREESDREKSFLLHRLNVLDIPFGQLMKASQNDKSTFNEYWKLQWKADFALRIIKAAGLFGNTVEVAATNALLRQAKETNDLPKLTLLIEQSLYANLTTALPTLLHHLENVTALTKDVLHLIDTLPILVRILRYGDARQTDVSAMEQIVQHSIPRICIGLPATCIAIDDELAADLLTKIRTAHQAIHLFQQPTYSQQWYEALEKIMQLPAVHALLQGAATRMLLDKNVLAASEVATRMHYALSQGNEPQDAAQWLEGFLYGSGLVLLYNTDLWEILDEWVTQLPLYDFREVLPLLRRTFSLFSQPEREKMMQLARKGVPQLAEQQPITHADAERLQRVRETVLLLLN